MSTIEKIEKILGTSLQMMEPILVPETGASDDEISVLDRDLPRQISDTHRKILRRWNGANLDVIRLFRGGLSIKKLPGLLDNQTSPLTDIPGVIVFASDPSGFEYGEASNGEILCHDTDGGEIKEIASSMEEFFDELIFGRKAVEFAGQDWYDELVAAGII